MDNNPRKTSWSHFGKELLALLGFILLLPVIYGIMLLVGFVGAIGEILFWIAVPIAGVLWVISLLRERFSGGK